MYSVECASIHLRLNIHCQLRVLIRKMVHGRFAVFILVLIAD